MRPIPASFCVPAPVSLWLCLLLGHALAASAPIPAAVEEPSRFAAFLLATASLGAACAGSRYNARVLAAVWLRRLEIVTGIAALIAAGGTLGAEADRMAAPLPVHPRAVRIEIEGRVLDSVAADAPQPTMVLEATLVRVGRASSPCKSMLLLRWGEDGFAPAWATPGLSVRLEGEYRPPEDARNPGSAAPGRWLERLHIAGTVDVDPATVTVLADPPDSGIPWSGLLRHRLAGIFSRDLCPPVAALARGMALGDRSGIAPSIRDAFRDGGTIHILSISGLHVCVLAGIVATVAVAVRLQATPALWIELISLWGYVLLVGAPASAVRSAILWTAIRAARMRGSAIRPFAAWGLAGLLLHLGNPDVLADPGFQLSFAAVLGLSASGGFRLAIPEGFGGRGSLRRVRGAMEWLLSLARQSAFAEAGTLGIQVLQFGAVPLAGLVLNLAVIPLCGAFMAALLLHLGCAFLIPPLGQVAAGSVEASGLLMLWLTARVAAVIPPLPARALPPPAAIAASLLALLLAAAAWEHARVERRPRDRRTAQWCALFALVLAWTVPFAVGRGPERREAWMLVIDVGQGDAVVAHAPGAAILVDAGPSTESRDEGRLAVEPALRAEGITRIHTAILSHAHRDHYGGLAWLAGRGYLRSLCENGRDPGGAWRGAIQLGLARAGGAPVAIRADTSFVLEGGSRLRILGADRGLPAGRSANAEENNRSLVAFLEMGGAEICLSGDVEREAEASLRWKIGIAQVMKVPHHGSKTSSDSAWVAATRPRIALISCGERNRFGHPDRATVGRYLLRGARVFRTDQEGAIRLTFAPHGAWVSTRAHPAPEFVRWDTNPALTPSGQSP
ncbi:MAG: DNA internalization-related competence protein ComEC/Rec2 [Candidatus Eisenbacteria bacterium]|uniref:DNA internalization-related competence protein ComEC/Rec2 n=1 Tax=Eiseniibacteriota bacterium TaxID=2212470 RepID=A0A538SPB2_UNCEI|nr:MAG: DNA internalization-related competence protein ComEC/Rec2 [Candidatus Eisenbacteria bacterium]